MFGFSIHAVIGIESTRYINTFDTRHTIATAGTSDLLMSFYLSDDILDEFLIFVIQTAWNCF